MIDKASMSVLRDLLDKQVRDRAGRPMGRADSVRMTLSPGGRPRLDSIVIGPVALAHRMSPRWGRWMARVERWMGLSRHRPVVIPLNRLELDRLEIKADVLGGETGAMQVEEMLQRWLARIPGSR
jgi:hypothetical protein